MANSLRAKLSKLRHDRHITEEEYQEIIKKLEGHDREVRKNTLKPLSDALREYKNGSLTSMEALREVYQIVEGQLQKEQKNES